MAIFIDAFYPDNKNRSRRLNELSSDCHGLFADAAVCKEDIEKRLKTCNEIVKQAYMSLAKEPPKEIEQKEIPQWPFYVTEVLTDIFAGTATIAALRWAVANYMVKSGTLTAERLAELGINNALKVVLPKWLKIGGEAGVMIIVTVVVDMIIDAADGAMERDKLKSGIQEIAKTRVQLKEIDMYNRNLLETLNSVIMACEVFEKLFIQTPQVLDDLLRGLVEAHKIKEEDISTQRAIDNLVNVDSIRKSWIAEDGDWKEIGQKDKKNRVRGIRMRNKVLFALEQVSDLSDWEKDEFVKQYEMLCAEG